jgi:ligand-binding SRPBCC domain-containing protein
MDNMRTPYELKREQWVPRPVGEVFEFFSNAMNLEVLTPPWLRFAVQTKGPIDIHPGTLIDYRLKWHGIPLRWRTEITRWEPTAMFEDLQLKGPYKLWHHTHTFIEQYGGTLMTDVVRYELPLGPLGRIAHALTVRRNVEQIFDYRFKKVKELFG